MLKKIFFVSTALITITNVTFASNAVPYIGASVGIVANTSSNVAGYPSQPGNFRGVPFNLLAGYGSVISQNFYLAGEVGGTAGTAAISNKNLRTSYGYGMSIIPGVMLSDHTLAFVQLGLVRSHFSSANKNVSGAQFGLGLQTSLTQNVDARVGYDFTAYHAFNNAAGRVSAPKSDAFNLGLIYKFD